jgi:hypothetical protein
VNRYKLSKQLPAIIETLDKRKCFHTAYDNFFTLALVDRNGNTIEYDIFFTASRSSRKRGVVNLYIQSAYVRDREHPNRPHLNLSRRPNLRPIGFYVILFNVLNNRPLKPAPK